MNDAQLIEQLAITDMCRGDVALPETTRPDMVYPDTARRMDIDTKERRVEVPAPQRRWNGAAIAAVAFAVVIIIGVAAVLLSNGSGVGKPVSPATTQVPHPTIAVESIDIGAADPIQAVNDQGSRVTITSLGTHEPWLRVGHMS
jgi:hypothetical protein